MRDRTQADSSESKRHLGLQEHLSDETAVKVARKAIVELAALSRGLRNATFMLKEVVRRAAGSSELVLHHWVILVHLMSLDINRQVDMARETGIPSHIFNQTARSPNGYEDGPS
jgi:hypothetical protein